MVTVLRTVAGSPSGTFFRTVANSASIIVLVRCTPPAAKRTPSASTALSPSAASEPLQGLILAIVVRDVERERHRRILADAIYEV